MPLNYNLAKFVRGYGAASQLSPSTYPEIAFCGRSNVGKSSLLNRLMGRTQKQLALVSARPGKTATINFYQVEKVHFVDLPGYGYARVGKEALERWSVLIDGYFTQKRRFAMVCCLVDIRLPPQKLDVNMVHYLTELVLPFCIVFTKADKLSKQAQLKQMKVLQQGLGAGEDVKMFLTSSEKGAGIGPLRTYIESAAQNA